MTFLETRDDLLAVVPKKFVIAELGVFTGAFSNTILRICEPAELHLVDSWEGTGERGDKDGENVQVVENLAIAYLALVVRGDPRYTLHRHTPQDALNQFPDDYFDFIYAERATYDDLVVSTSKALWGIGGHNYQDHSTAHAVAQFCREYNWELTHLTYDKRPSYLLRPR